MERGLGAQENTKRLSIPSTLLSAVKIIMLSMEIRTMWNQKQTYREADWMSCSNHLPQLQT